MAQKLEKIVCPGPLLWRPEIFNYIGMFDVFTGAFTKFQYMLRTAHSTS